MPLSEQSTAEAEKCACLGRKAHPSSMHLLAILKLLFGQQSSTFVLRKISPLFWS